MAQDVGRNPVGRFCRDFTEREPLILGFMFSLTANASWGNTTTSFTFGTCQALEWIDSFVICLNDNLVCYLLPHVLSLAPKGHCCHTDEDVPWPVNYRWGSQPASMQDYIFPVGVCFTWLLIKPLQNKYARPESYKQEKKNRELKVMYKKAMQGDLAAHIKHL